MPLSGVLAADFSPFTTAVNSATLELKSFEDSATKVSSTLTRMADSFSGRKVIQDATMMVKVVEDLGGVSRLTAAELQKLGPALNEAVDKMKAVGQAVPASMQKMADETKQANISVQDLLGTVAGIGSMFGLALTAQGVIDFTKSIIASATATADLADRLGITTDQVQKLSYIAVSGGTSLDKMTSSAEQLRVKLDQTDVQGVIRGMGLSLEELKSANPYELLQKIGQGLKGIEDEGKRAEAAGTLFGKNYGEVLQALTSDWEKLGVAANVASEAQIRSLKAASDAWQRFQTQFMNESVQQMGNVILAFEALGNESISVKDKLFAFASGSISGPMGVTAALAALSQAGKNAQKDINLPVETAPIADYAMKLNGLSVEFGKLSDWQKAVIEQAFALGESNSSIAAGLNISVGIVTKYTDGLKKGAEEAKKLADAQSELNSVGSDWQTTLAGMNQDLVATLTYYTQAGVSAQALATIYGATDAQIKAITESLKAQKKQFEETDASILRTRENWRQLGEATAATLATTSEAQRAAVQQWLDGEVAKLQKTKETNANYANEMLSLQSIAQEKLSLIGVNWDQLKDVSKASLEDTAATAQRTYEYALANSTLFKDGAVAHFKELADKSREALGVTMANVGEWAEKQQAAFYEVWDAEKQATEGAQAHAAANQQLAQSFQVVIKSAAEWREQAARLYEDAARMETSPSSQWASGSSFVWQSIQNARAGARHAEQSAAYEDTIQSRIAAQSVGWGQRGGSWNVTVNAMQGIDGDQIASSLVSGMRKRGVSPGTA